MNMKQEFDKKFLIKPQMTKTKGQLISKCPSGVIVWTKIPTRKFDNFCPSPRSNQKDKDTLYR